MIDHRPYIGRVYTKLTKFLQVHTPEIGDSRTGRWARISLRPPYPEGFAGGRVEWTETAGWSLLALNSGKLAQRYWLNNGIVTPPSRVADWATAAIEDLRDPDEDHLFSLTDLHTQPSIHNVQQGLIDSELATYESSPWRYSGIWATAQLPRAKSEKPGIRTASLTMSDVMHEYLIGHKVRSGQFAVRNSHDKWRRGNYLGVFIGAHALHGRSVVGLGVTSPVGRSGTFERKVAVSHFSLLAIPVPLDLLQGLGKVAMECLEHNRGLPPATGRKVLAELAKNSGEASTLIRTLEEHLLSEEPDISDRPSRALERDALGVLFEAFDIERDHLLDWSRTEESAPFLAGLTKANTSTRLTPQEKWQIDFDATNFPGWKFHNTAHVAWRRFRNKYGNRSLLVANMDRTPTESKTGVDLVYYNPHGGNFVMLQYKTMRESAGGLYSSIDDRFLKQIQRMRELDEKSRDPTPRHPDIRLVETPCFVKLCAPQTRMPVDAELVPGMYFTREHFEAIHEHAEELGATSAKNRHQAEIPRYLTGTEFISLMSNGWLGSRGTGTDQLYEQLDLSLAEGRSVVLGTHTDGRPLMNHSSGDWQEVI